MMASLSFSNNFLVVGYTAFISEICLPQMLSNIHSFQQLSLIVCSYTMSTCDNFNEAQLAKLVMNTY